MQHGELLHPLRRQRWAVVSTVSPDGMPESALVGVAVTAQLEQFRFGELAP